jgi:hypothetical protein
MIPQREIGDPKFFVGLDWRISHWEVLPKEGIGIIETHLTGLLPLCCWGLCGHRSTPRGAKDERAMSDDSDESVMILIIMVWVVIISLVAAIESRIRVKTGVCASFDFMVYILSLELERLFTL